MLAVITRCAQRKIVAPLRWSSLNQQFRFSRFDRTEIRGRLKKFKDTKRVDDFNVPYRSDLIPVRSPKHLWRALGFTCAVGGLSFSLAAVNHYERSRREMMKFWSDTVSAFGNSPRTMSNRLENDWWSRIGAGHKCALAIFAVNSLVFLLWKAKNLQPFMWKWFTNSYASKALCAPMVLSAFSHSHGLHLALNMYVLYSFAAVSIDRFLGVDQFLAFYLTSAAVSSLSSLMHKSAVRSSTRALGASGAILAVLVYTCMRIPNARLQIVFIPGFDFSAKSAVVGLFLFDLVGLIFRFRLFDHAAHLGGTLFGIFYGLYGEDLIWRRFCGRIVQIYRSSTERGR